MTDNEMAWRAADFSINYVMIVQISGRAAEADLRRALKRLPLRHRLLAPDPEHSLCALRVEKDCGAGDWRGVMVEELRNSQWDEKQGPFARFVLLEREGGADLIGVFNHRACDGMSGVYVMRDILQMWGDPALELPALPVPPEVGTLIPQAVLENPKVKIRLEITVAALRALGLKHRLFPPRHTSVAPWTGEGLPPERRLIVEMRTLSKEQSTRLAERCRVEGSTVYAAAVTAFMRAFAAQLPQGSSWKRSISCPVSLRERLRAPVDEVVGQYLALANLDVDCAPGREFWEVARELKGELKRKTSAENVFLFPLTMQTLGQRCSPREMGAVAGAFFGGPVRYDFSITNLGRLDFPTQIGALKVEAFYNLVNTSEYEKTLGMNSFDGRLSFIFALRESNMRPEAAKRLLDEAMEVLVGS